MPPPELPKYGSNLVPPRGAEPESEIVGPVAGRYDLDERIAKGGMGIVYRAMDRLLNRTVAIKIIRTRFLERPDLLRRFLTEARINGRLQHPGIVPVYEFGTLPDARPFLAMKLVEGRTLSRLLRERKDPADSLPHFLKVFEALCRTVAYAHQQGVIHRDLKPDNVMVGEFGEVQVMDWGLAKFLDPAAAFAPTPDGFEAIERSAYLSGDGSTPAGDYQTQVTTVQALGPDTPAGYTTAGEVIGTLTYMPPEQARGEADRVDRRGDVFSLGAILCEVLTGHPPYFGAPETLRAQAREGKLFGAYILLDRCGAPAALVALAKRCLIANPEDRPADAGVLAALVTECLDRLQTQTRAIEVKRATAEARLAEAEARERLVRKARRLSRTLAVVGVLVAGLLASGLGWYANERAARNADENRRRAAVMQQIEATMAQAEALNKQAEEERGSATVRDAAAKQALSALQRAEALFVAAPTPQGEISERFAEIKSRVTTTERGARLSLELEKWRTDLFDAQGRARPAAVQQLGKLLEQDGIVVQDCQRAELNGHPAAAALRAVLTDWAAVAESRTERWYLVTLVWHARESLPRDWMNALFNRERESMLALTATEPTWEIPASWLIVSARWLRDENQEGGAERLLVYGVRNFPADFTLNAMYGALLRHKPGAEADSLRYLTAARTMRPDDVIVQQELGMALADTGRADEALDVLRAAVQAGPTWVAGHIRIGELLEKRGDEAALDAFAAAAQLQPESAEHRVKLGEALSRFGRFHEAAATLQEAGDRLQADSPRRTALQSQARSAMKFAVLSDRLLNVLAGTLTPGTPEGWADYGDVARRSRRYAAAARCFAAAAEEDKRYVGPAAICAALAGFGRGSDAKDLSPTARAALRKRALTAFRRVRDAAADPLLEPLKSPAGLSALPEEERAAWRALWAGR
ncbi:MAG TPA: protein kinase [Gemmataceae bacterium]|nr:protein kinase [Gemmataceae bacterium]